MPGMTGGSTHLFNPDEETVTVTINLDFLNLLNISRTFAFEPERLPGTAPKDAFLEPHGPVNRRFIHIRDHENAVVLRILNHGWNESFAIKFERLVKVLHEFIELPFLSFADNV